MSQRKERERKVLVGKWHSAHMGTDGRQVHAVSKHHTLAQARSTTCIENIGKVVLIQLCRSAPDVIPVLLALSQTQELIKINADLILRILLHAAVKDYQLAHLGIYLQHTICRIILILLSHKDETHLGIAHHVLHLHLTAGGIERNRNHASRICAKVHIQAFRHILGKNHDILLNTHPQLKQSIAHLPHPHREVIPGNIIPVA